MTIFFLNNIFWLVLDLILWSQYCPAPIRGYQQTPPHKSLVGGLRDTLVLLWGLNLWPHRALNMWFFCKLKWSSSSCFNSNLAAFCLASQEGVTAALFLAPVQPVLCAKTRLLDSLDSVEITWSHCPSCRSCAILLQSPPALAAPFYIRARQIDKSFRHNPPGMGPIPLIA